MASKEERVDSAATAVAAAAAKQVRNNAI